MADTGFGITITFSSGFMAKIRNVSGPDMSREVINVSHAGTADGFIEKIFADLVDGGTVDVDLIFNPDTPPPINQPVEAVTINYPLPAGMVTPPTWAFQGGLSNYRGEAPYDDLMTATATLAVCGKITFTASAAA